MITDKGLITVALILGLSFTLPKCDGARFQPDKERSFQECVKHHHPSACKKHSL